MMKKSIFAMLAITSIFVSCTKDENSLQNKSNNVTERQTKSANIINPYEFVGELHNEILDEFAIQNFEALTGESEGEIYEKSCTVVTNVLGDVFSAPEYETFCQQLSTSTNLTVNWLNNNLTTEMFEDQNLFNLYTQINELLTTKIGLNILPTPESFFSSIQEMEIKVLSFEKHTSNPDLNSKINEYDELLIFLSIVKYSYKYWYSASLDENNLWHKYLLDNYTKKLSFSWLTNAWNACVSFIQSINWGAVWKTALTDAGVAIGMSGPINFLNTGVFNIFIKDPVSIGFSIGAGAIASVLYATNH